MAEQRSAARRPAEQERIVQELRRLTREVPALPVGDLLALQDEAEALLNVERLTPREVRAALRRARRA